MKYYVEQAFQPASGGSLERLPHIVSCKKGTASTEQYKNRHLTLA